MKVKTFKKNSTRGEITCSSTASEEIPSHLVTDELISRKNIGKESAARVTNQMREGMITLRHPVPCAPAAALSFIPLFFVTNHVSEQLSFNPLN